MRLQEHIVAEAKRAAEQVFTYAKAVPVDRLDCSPEGARSVLSICRELALTPTWTLAAFGAIPGFGTPENREALRKEQESWMTAEVCEAEFHLRFAEVEKLFLGFSDEDLAKTKWLPFNGGRDHTYLEMMDYPRWNCTYHTGQIAYIQTMYGDRENY